MIDSGKKKEDIAIYGSHDALRNYIYIDDLTTIISKVVSLKVEGIYSCMQMTDLTYSQIAKAVNAAFNSNGKIIFLKEKENIADNIFEKEDSLYEKINFYPRISIEEGMKIIANHLYKS